MLALVMAALLAFCGHPGRHNAERRAAPSPSTHRRASSWAFQYVHFVTRSDGWAMAANDQSGFTYLFTSHDGGRRWHNVTPPTVVASDNAWLYDSSHNLDMESTPGGPIEDAATVQALTPFVLNSRDAWLPVARDYGPGDQSSELYVYMTSDAGRIWARRGRFPGAGWGDIFFLSRSIGFIQTGDAAAAGEEPVQIYATRDGGKHWREVSAGPRFSGRGRRAAARLPSAMNATRTACLSPAPGSASPPRPASPGRRSNARATGAISGLTSALPPVSMAGPPTLLCSPPQPSAAWWWRQTPYSSLPPPPTAAATGT